MELSPQTIKTYGADRIAAATGLSRRTIYRWAAEGVPGKGTVGAVRKAVVDKALQLIAAPPKPKRRAA